MPHPNGGRGNYFGPAHSFDEAYNYVGYGSVAFTSTTDEHIIASRGMARGGITPTIVFNGEKVRHGNVCHSCWGYRKNCSGTRIGQCTEALDKVVP